MQPEGHEILDEQVAEEVRQTARRGPFRFSDVGIPFGSEIVYVEDDTVKPTVVDDRHIEYGGEITSLSALAQRLKGFDHPTQGTLWFSYNGEKIGQGRENVKSYLKNNPELLEYIDGLVRAKLGMNEEEEEPAAAPAQAPAKAASQKAAGAKGSEDLADLGPKVEY